MCSSLASSHFMTPPHPRLKLARLPARPAESAKQSFHIFAATVLRRRNGSSNPARQHSATCASSRSHC